MAFATCNDLRDLNKTFAQMLFVVETAPNTKEKPNLSSTNFGTCLSTLQTYYEPWMSEFPSNMRIKQANTHIDSPCRFLCVLQHEVDNVVIARHPLNWSSEATLREEILMHIMDETVQIQNIAIVHNSEFDHAKREKYWQRLSWFMRGWNSQKTELIVKGESLEFARILITMDPSADHVCLCHLMQNGDKCISCRF